MISVLFDGSLAMAVWRVRLWGMLWNDYDIYDDAEVPLQQFGLKWLEYSLPSRSFPVVDRPSLDCLHSRFPTRPFYLY